MSLMGKAQARGLVDFRVTNPRDFTTDRHRTVDDTPYGGGEGMVLKADVLAAAWRHALGASLGATEAPKACRTILLSPQGKHLDQELVRELAGLEKLILVCGHYEGVDERFIEACVDQEVSIGDFVLTGGELPALVLADAVTRLLPGVVGNPDSVARDSFENGLLKHAQYTRPRVFEGREVPGVLLGGDHAAIARWRLAESEARTARKRPDLWHRYLGVRTPSE
jgi:tRNA (guanine37-N1)-methyltransferase